MAGVTEFEQWINDPARVSPEGGRGHGPSVNSLLNRAPEFLAELADWFVTLKENELASVWVAAVVERVIERDLSPGDMARALVVVAERLHGVKVEISEGVPVVMNPGKASPINQNPPPKGPPPAVQTRPPGSIPNPVPPRPAALPDGVSGAGGKYQVNVGEPPAPRPRRAKANEAMAQAEMLPPGGWFEWTDAAKTVNCKVTAEKWTAAFKRVIVIYRASSGRVIVKRPASV